MTDPAPDTASDPALSSAPDPAAPYPLRWWGLAVLCCAIAILAIDTTVLNFAIPAITTDLYPSATQMLWVVDVYAFVVAALLVTMGTVGDRIGRRRLLLWGAFFFGVASVAAAFSRTPEMLIAARAVQGAAGATLMPSTLSLIRAMFNNAAERARAVSLWVAVYSVGAAVGPLLGGFLLENFHWGSVFLINVPLVAVIILGGLCVLPKSAPTNTGLFDVKGAVLSIIALFSLVYVVKVLPVEGPSLLVALAAVTTAVTGFLLTRHLCSTPHPLIDVALLKDPVYTTVVVVNGVSMFLYIGMLFYLSQYLQLVLGYSPVQAALMMIPGLLSSLVATLITGRIMTGLSSRKILIRAFLITAVASLILGADALAVFEHIGGSGVWLGIGFAVLGVGVGMIDPVSNDFILSAAPPDRAGAAASLSETGYELGGAFGTAVLGSVLLAVYGHRLSLTTHVPEAARESLTRAHELAAGDAQVIAAADDAFRLGVVASSIVAAAAALGVALLVARFVPKHT